jgi:hypothetical protein
MKVKTCLLSAVAFASVALAAPTARALTFEYCDFSNVSTLTINGNASRLMNTLELTRNTLTQAGSAFRTVPVAWNAATSFHTYFTFQLSPNAAGADGIAFVLQNSLVGAAALGRNGGALGYGNDSGTPPNIGGIGASVEVEFDTFQNAWDPNANHVGIMENGNNNVHQATGTPSFTMANGGKLYAWIDYNAPTTTLSVYLAQTATKPAAPVVSDTAINVATLVGAQAFAGFTGGTGGSTNLQQILEWEFSTDGVPCVCDGNSNCGAPTPYCAPTGDPEAGLCVACVTDAECDSNTNTATPVCSKAAASADTCVACSANADCATAGLAPVCDTSGAFAGQCVTCATNADCAGNAAGPVCFPEAATNACVQCASDANCSGATPICSATTHTCQPCATDSDCAGSTPACQKTGALAGECTQCSGTNLTACSMVAPVCDSQTGTCVGCQTNADCAGSSPICNLSTNTCRACQASADCASFSGDPVCATTGMKQGQCVACQSNGDCPANRSFCDTATNTCTGCVTSADCSGAMPICSASLGACLPCNSDTQCAALPQTGTPLPLCETMGSLAGGCVQCTAQNTSQCTAGEVCVGGRCGGGSVDAGPGGDGGVVEGGAGDGGLTEGGRGDGGIVDGGIPDGTAADGAPGDGGGPRDGSAEAGEIYDAAPPFETSDEGGSPVADGASTAEASGDGEVLVETGSTESGTGGLSDNSGDAGGGGCACSTPGTLGPTGGGGAVGLLVGLAVLARRRRRG